MKQFFSTVAAALALALLVASTAGAVNDLDDELDDGDVAVDCSDVVTMAVPPELAEHSATFRVVMHSHDAVFSTGREVASTIFRPPI